MKHIEINLGAPFSEIVARAIALPDNGGSESTNDGQIVHALRRLYELAHGHSVETVIGLIPIAPPVASGLANTRFSIGSRRELLAIVEEKIASTGTPKGDQARHPLVDRLGTGRIPHRSARRDGIFGKPRLPMRPGQLISLN
jgi:hypothetical protein